MKKVALGCDHAGFPYKSAVVSLLQTQGHDVLDFGTYSLDSVDYPDFVHPVARAIEEGRADMGIVMCGSGNGVAITANKHAGIRAALCWKREIAEFARLHNDANVIALPVRFVTETEALEMVSLFLDTAFEGGRHATRVGKISC